MNDVTKRGYEAELAKRFAEKFPTSSFGSSGVRGLTAMEIVGAIGGDIEESEAQLMMDLGLFGEVRRSPYLLGRVSTEGVLRFIEQHGEEWTRVRREKMLATLRAQAEREQQTLLEAVGADDDLALVGTTTARALEQIAEAAAA